jgi:hypothetical protein
MRPDGTARNLYISSPRDIVVSVYDSDTYIIPFFKVIANAFSILCFFLAFICVFYMYTINLSFPYFNTEVIYMSLPEHRLLSCGLLPWSVYFVLIQRLKTRSYQWKMWKNTLYVCAVWLGVVVCVCCVARRRFMCVLCG